MPSPRDYHEHYARCLANGCTAALADMLAARAYPGVKGTDRAFLEGLHTETTDDTLRDYRAEAEGLGVSTNGKKYLGQLAEYPGDPRAWVSDLYDAKAVLKERGWGCSGAFESKPIMREDPPPPPPRPDHGPLPEPRIGYIPPESEQ